MRASSLVATAILFFATGADAADLTGKWSGTWRDTKSGHSGPMRATFTKCADDQYRVTFTGRFFKVIPFRYSVVLTVTAESGDKVYLTGTQSIPLFGTFSYSAEADATDFVSQFCSRRYQGEFVLRRECR